MTEIMQTTNDDVVPPNEAANKNKDKAVSGRPLKAATVPDSQARGDQFGHVPAAKGSKPVGTGTIPAVDDTTLTQVPHAATMRQINPNAEPFGREMNHPGATPGEHFVRDPQVYPTDPTFHGDTDGDKSRSQAARPLSSSSVQGSGQSKDRA